MYPPSYPPSYSYHPSLQAAPVTYNYQAAPLAPVAPTLPSVAATGPPAEALGLAVEGLAGGLDPAVRGVGPAAGQAGPSVSHSVAAVADVSHLETSQYHAQDEQGNYSFGYNNPNSARMETGNPHTGVRGSVYQSISI